MAKRTIGIDTGGTFTDLVLVEGDDVRVAKVPSTPRNPALAVLAGLEALGEVAEGDHVIHGTTVALNALLTGKVGKVALVTGKGFRDLIEIGRQERPAIYDLHPTKPAPLVPRSLRFEVEQRTWPDPEGKGFVEVAGPTAAQLAELRQRVAKRKPQSLAICLLHSWADPMSERNVASALESLDLPITCSAAVLPQHREVERFSTAIVNAALVPLMRDYLGPLEERVSPARLSILQSNGGTLRSRDAAEEPVRVLLSGPAGGVVGASRAAAEAGLGDFCALDMGGTSTDVAFARAAREEPQATRALEPVHVAGHPIGVPTLDIHTIGCGGGSLVSVDAGGILHVGPASAGADPGPACYGKSDRVTVTDAHVLLGHIAEGPFLTGGLALDTEQVRRSFEELGRKLSSTATDVAQGVLEVARASMRRAIGVMTMQRGHDPRGLYLVAFGGAGGLQAAALAQSLGLRGALVPSHPGALSARGMSVAEPIRHRARTLLAPLDALGEEELRRGLDALRDEGRAELVADGFRADRVHLDEGYDLRYRGQSYEIFVPHGADPAESFHRAHEHLYGYRLADRAIEVVCLRVRASVPARGDVAREITTCPLDPAAQVGRRKAFFPGREGALETPVLDRSRFREGQRFAGPALVEEYSGTTLVPPGWRGTVTAGGHLLLEPVPG